jgi:hypothetical protein
MAISSVITQNVPSNTQQIIFNNPSEFENISYSSIGITYAAESSTALSQEDFITFYQNKLQFYNSLLVNFPSIANYFNLKLPVSKFDILSLSGPNLIEYTQTSTSSPISKVYNLTFDRVALTMTFAARVNPIIITLQEFLIGFQWITQFYNQIKLS